MRTPGPEPKHRRPLLREGLVPRNRLVRRLLGSADLPVALLIAPAGYGKTTLLGQWDKQDRRPFGWVTLDEHDNDPARLLTGIAFALDTIERFDRGERGGPAAKHADSGEQLDSFLGSLAGRRPFVLVLDDVQVVRAEGSLKVLSAIAGRLPWGSQLALASRDEPRIPVGRMRANRGVVELRTPDLVMTLSEAAALLRKAGVALDGTSVEAIVRQAEGWPAALYLAALSLAQSPDPARAVMRFGGDDRLMADYLRDEVLRGLSPQQITFLTRAAVLDRLSGPLCDAVLNRSGSGRMLAELERANVLVFPAEDPGCHRCHLLLAQMLRADLRRREPDLEPQLHRRAAAWHARQGDIESAVHHAVAAKDAGLAGTLLWSNLVRYVAYGRNASIERWLDRFSEDEIAEHPALALVAAGSQLARGNRNYVAHWTSAASQALSHNGGAPRSMKAALALLRAAVATEGVSTALGDAERAYRLFAEDDPWRSLCCFLIGAARHLRGDRDEAQRALEEGARRGAVRAPSVQALCLAQLSLLAVEEGDWTRAGIHAVRARRQIERYRLVEYPTSALVLALAAVSSAHEGRVDSAKRDARRAAELVGRLTDFAPWYVAEVRIALALTALRLSDVANARGHLGHASSLVRQSPDAVVLKEWLGESWERAASAAGHSVGDQWSLTSAELRVTQFLPTHLSFPEIAARLNVSANTVKTHIRAVYRKLDASSRSEAVAHARRAGLIDSASSALPRAA
jgi:LuxR family transcriptional regulator, maltose regulon positive regulatory protein